MLVRVVVALAVLLLVVVAYGLTAVRSPGIDPVTVPSVARA